MAKATKAKSTKTKKKAARKQAPGRKSPEKPLTPEERHQMIAEAAYYRALERGPDNPDPEADWYAAEQMIDSKYSSRFPGSRAGQKTGLEDPRRRRSQGSARTKI